MIRGPIMDVEGHHYASAGGFHVRAVRIGTWAYYVAWFKGRRVK